MGNGAGLSGAGVAWLAGGSFGPVGAETPLPQHLHRHGHLDRIPDSGPTRRVCTSLLIRKIYDPGADADADADADPAPGQSCGDDVVYDCRLECVEQEVVDAYLGDDFCDDGSIDYDFSCEALDFGGSELV